MGLTFEKPADQNPISPEELAKLQALLKLQEGSSTSGNFGHAGRPGEVGGSGPGGGGGTTDAGGEIGRIKGGTPSQKVLLTKIVKGLPKLATEGTKIRIGQPLSSEDQEAEYNPYSKEIIISPKLLDSKFFSDYQMGMAYAASHPKERVVIAASFAEKFGLQQGDNTKAYKANVVAHEAGHAVWHNLSSEEQGQFITAFSKLNTYTTNAYANYWSDRASGEVAGIGDERYALMMKDRKLGSERFAEAFRLHVTQGKFAREFRRIKDRIGESIVTEGSASSGNFGHAGRPGEVGGSAPSGAGGSSDAGGSGFKFSGKPSNPNGRDTLEKYTDAQGNYTPERIALHQQIREKVFAGTSHVENPVAYVLGGGPASGKSTLAQSGNLPLPENLVRVNADDIKEDLPEFVEGVKNKVADIGAFVHEESSRLSKELAAEAGAMGCNVLLDGTGDGKMSNLERKVTAMRAHGQKVVAIYVTVPAEVALARNIDRAKRTGRLVPETVLRETYKGVARIVPEAIKRRMFDEYSVWDTREQPPIKLASGTKHGKLVVHNEALWKEFLAQGD